MPGPSDPGPTDLGAKLQLYGLLIAGALVGFAVVLWIAANWDTIGKVGRFALVLSVILASATVSAFSQRLRVAAGLAGILAIGALFAVYGQTYQVRSNAYELFAIWAAVTLPWALALRHDSAWSLWTLIAFTTFPLWLLVQRGGLVQPAEIVLPVWAAAVGISFALSPWSRLEAWLGAAHWASRLATVLTLALVATYTLPGIIDPGAAGYLGTITGAALVAGAVALFARTRPISFSLLSLSSLALVVLLITIAGRLILTHFEFVFGVLLTAIVAVGITAWSAKALMRVAADARPEDTAKLPTWPIGLLSGFGALIASVFLLIYLVWLFREVLENTAGVYVVGALLVAAATVAMRASASLSFRQHMAFVGVLAGLAFLGFGLFRDLPQVYALLAILIGCLALTGLISVRWVVFLLGAMAAVVFTALIARLTFAGDLPNSSLAFALSNTSFALLIGATLGATAIYVLAFWQTPGTGSIAALAWQRLPDFSAGWCGAVLLWLMLGNNTFLLSPGFQRLTRSLNETSTLDLPPDLTKTAAVILVAAGAYLLRNQKAVWRTLPALALFVAAACIAYVHPAFAGAFIIFAAARLADRRALTYVAASAMIWLVGSFYYFLGWPLLSKAYFLGGLGLSLGAVLWFTGDRQTLGISLPTFGQSGTSPLYAGVLTLATVLATTAVFGAGVWEKEDVLANGRRVFIALAPVDPRSPIRGDYMALRFSTPNTEDEIRRRFVSRAPVWAVARIDARGIATIHTYAEQNAPASATEIRIRVRPRNRARPRTAVLVGTDAYFFEEGQGPKFEAARYGVFRVGHNGEPILIGLADENLNRIE